VTVGIVHKVFY